jgi:uncharacterized protein YprB with RNaseH-like and TPR domain/predicted nuclease with RNAse H fold
MLTCTFRHFKGIGAKTERELWRSGVLNWEAFATKKAAQLSMFDIADTDDESAQVWISQTALAQADADYFARHLPRPEHYRIALGFPLQTLFLDIETTGLSRYYDAITLVGWSVGEKYGIYIKGDDPKPLLGAISDAKALVTFNGSLFDIPFLQQEFPCMNIPAAHIDLRFLSKRVGLVGGQKEIESRVGLQRPGVLSQLRGEAAPILWHKYRRGDIESLKLLISYNYADIEGMKFLLDTVVERFMDLNQLPKAIRPYKFSRGISHLKADELFGGTKLVVREYEGNRGPLIHIDDLNVPHHHIVGIDLTGSETRPSGWSFLNNGKVSTRRIGSDDELIAATLAARPELISIDSPLTLPKGRISISDDDPGRQLYGITRECERILKKRGVNVYPSLIQSMQALTARGIRLAKYFRNIGIPVIESYPGAAQDIMNIPRKRADISLLKEGLLEFGISGEFKHQEVSHDELDAITSAIVGLFFLSGRFEALGNDDEEYLIIPDLKKARFVAS